MGLFDFLKKSGGASSSRQDQDHLMLELALQDLSIREDDVVLEIGFGAGQALRRLVPLLTKGRLSGIETSRLAIEQAQKDFAKEFSNFRVDFRDGVASKMPFYDGQFTKVLCLDQLHTWINFDKTLDEINRVTAPGGKLVLVWGQPLDGDTQSSRPMIMPEEIKQLLHLAGFHSPHLRERVGEDLRYFQVAVEKP